MGGYSVRDRQGQNVPDSHIYAAGTITAALIFGAG